MDTYSSQVISHAGYFIALAIGVASIFLNKAIFGFFWKYKLSFCAIIIILANVALFLVNRIVYWAWMESTVLTITYGHVSSFSQVTDVYGLQMELIKDFSALASNGTSIHRFASAYSYSGIENITTTSFAIWTVGSLVILLPIIWILLKFNFIEKLNIVKEKVGSKIKFLKRGS